MNCLVDRADHTKFVYRSGSLHEEVIVERRRWRLGNASVYCVHLLITLINLPTFSSVQDKNNLHDSFAKNVSSYCHKNYSNS